MYEECFTCRWGCGYSARDSGLSAGVWKVDVSSKTTMDPSDALLKLLPVDFTTCSVVKSKNPAVFRMSHLL